jgi:hypothetical protein
LKAGTPRSEERGNVDDVAVAQPDKKAVKTKTDAMRKLIK